MENLTCILCNKQFRDPKMCSGCSQIFCQPCLDIQFRVMKLCPSCYRPVPMVDCSRLLAEVKQLVGLNKDIQFKSCLIHALPLKYFCIDCKCSICADCGVIDNIHRGHHIRPRQSQAVPIQQLQQCLVGLSQKILKGHSKIQSLLLQKQVVKSQLKWSKNRLIQYCDNFLSRLQGEANKYLIQIQKQIIIKENQLQKFRWLKEELSRIMEMSQQRIAQGQWSNLSSQILQMMNNGQQQNDIQQAIIKQKQFITMKQLQPQYINQTFQFQWQGGQDVHYSDVYHINGQQWRLKVYPEGNGQSPGYLSFFLQMLNNNNLPKQPALNYYFRLQLISLNSAGKTISKQYRMPFGPGDCWGYSDFMPLEQLQQYLNSGRLLFVMGIRQVSYYDVCLNMRRYIRQLQGQKQVLQGLMSRERYDKSDQVWSSYQSQQQYQLI